MPNQHRLWSDPRVVAERRDVAEAFLGREMEMPGRRYDETERRIAAAHLVAVASGETIENEEAA